MRTTIDKAGRLVIPKSLRDQMGLRSGEVEISCDGVGLHIEAVASGDLLEVGGRLVIPSSGTELDDETVRAMRYADQR